MTEIIRLKPEDRVEVIDDTNPHFGKTGVYVSGDSKQGRNLKTGLLFEEIYAYVRMDDTAILETFTNLTKPLASQIKKLE